ncbi:ricin-type beta-trefoil lectin domain protein [Actinokineospora iranica]|uniref:ricin-type beta-trefoil lectin domain protein n=1 Tax=Actinokineospora iranica TaxID=1271860 RepID=UPI000B826CBC|nr:ricin-type beta-trefoil lectin domain protein [Actinokineospora iranica]
MDAEEEPGITTLGELGGYLRALRKGQGLSQDNVSGRAARQHLKIRRERVSEIENAKREPPTERELLAILTALRRPAADIERLQAARARILGGESESPVEPTPARRKTRLLTVAAAVAIVAASVAVLWSSRGDEPVATPQPVAAWGAPPGALTPCETVDGQQHFECFLFSQGNPSYALDFYAHSYEVVIWERKPDNDTYAWSQRWQFWRIADRDAYLLRNPRTTQCLTALGPDLGMPLSITPCDPANPHQLWNRRDGTLKTQSGMCVDVPREQYRMGEKPYLYPCHGRANQVWLARHT